MIKFTEVDDSGEEIEHELPSKFEVCSECEGNGTHLAPSIGEHAYSAEEFNERALMRKSAVSTSDEVAGMMCSALTVKASELKK